MLMVMVYLASRVAGGLGKDVDMLQSWRQLAADKGVASRTERRPTVPQSNAQLP